MTVYYCRASKLIVIKFISYITGLKAHHNVMTAAMKSKQSVDVSAADALEHAVGDMVKMYMPVE